MCAAVLQHCPLMTMNGQPYPVHRTMHCGPTQCTVYTSNGDPVDKRALGADFDVLSRADQVCASQATMRDGEPFKILRKLSFDRARVTRVAGHPTQVRSGDQGGDR